VKTGCSRLSFGSPGRREVVGAFDGGQISSDGGLMLMAELDRVYGVTARIAGGIRERRQVAKIQEPLVDMFRQRTYQIVAGYEDCNDAAQMGGDAVLKLAVNRYPESDPDLASQPTLSRFENSVSRTDLYRMSVALAELFIAQSRAPQQIILDIDPTVDPTHGSQQLSLFNGFYDTHCYLPVLVFGSADGGPHQPVAAVLRSGKASPGVGARQILKRLVAKLREAWPNTRILIRGDSGFALPELYDWCEAEPAVDYLFGLSKNSRLEELIEPHLVTARTQHLLHGAKVRRLRETRYAAHTWPHERRVIMKAEVSDQGDNPRFVVTSLEQGTTDEIYQLYADRGDAENRIKELKNDLHADRTSCTRFLANQFRLLLHTTAYALICLLRTQLAGTALATAQAGTLRNKLIKVGVRVRQTVRKVWLHFASAHPFQHLWETLLARLRTVSTPHPTSRTANPPSPDTRPAAIDSPPAAASCIPAPLRL